MDNDYDVSIFIITEYNEKVYVNEYYREDDGRGIFIMATNDLLNNDYGEDNTICLYRNTKEIQERAFESFSHLGLKTDCYEGYHALPFQIEKVSIPGTFEISRHSDIQKMVKMTNRELVDFAIQFLDGYNSTRMIIKNVGHLLKEQDIKGYIPAAMFAYDCKVNFNNKIYNGYLPGLYQLLFISKNSLSLNKAFIKISDQNYTFESVTRLLTVLSNKMNRSWWSSNRFDSDMGCILANGGIYHTEVTSSNFILPLYKV